MKCRAFTFRLYRERWREKSSMLQKPQQSSFRRYAEKNKVSTHTLDTAKIHQ